MAIFNINKRELTCKIVYYGPRRSGKSTNMGYIYNTYKKQVVGKMASVDTESDRTLFFDFLPMGFGQIKGFDIKSQVYAISGQVQYQSTRKLVLKGVDGVIFVADSLAIRHEKNILSLKNLQHNLKEYGISILKIPLVMQHNKRDLAGQNVPVMTIEQMERDLNKQLKAPSFPASAITGEGVGVTLRECLKLTLLSLKNKLNQNKESMGNFVLE